MIVELRDAVVPTCGGKAGALGALVRAGLPVPDGFAVPLDVHRAAARQGADRSVPPRAGDDAPESLPLPTGLVEALAGGLRALGDVPVAVRSSAMGEDTAEASAAGQHESVLAVSGVDDVVLAVRACWASLDSERAAAYRDAARGAPSAGMAVLVQRLVDAEVSGVMFTAADPRGETRIEASWGLGPSVVGGVVTPDAYRVAADGAVTRTLGDKRTRLDRVGGELVTSAVAHTRRHALDDSTLRALVALGRRIATLLGRPQDVEWALAGGTLWVLQARPVTAAPPPPAAAVPTATGGVLTGTPGSAGTVTGPARVVRGATDFHRVRPGDVLVCPYTDPAWTPLLRIVAGVVTETGGVLSHAAIVARELRIPAVLGVTDATTRVDDGVHLTVDGAAGTVTPRVT
ncbi:pyruvate, phosphate dikinase [Actinotalea ferrariae]|uniref:PEP/pyruvate-binding domain-containing protein n=1 Tax=Actinotalea ferrariae TaxID=1386098 RepID=UPI001C8BF5BB|nr:PEP/pyruvate-binding domain-containing protein [Actinotalea ferrariae]MBX9245606.1 pyruvate, phosphate dikinase [Actinotalea ferrariae]